MPYITKEEVDAKRKAIKTEFPDFKFSITKDNHSGIRVNILEGPMNLGDAFGSSWMPHYRGENRPEAAKEMLNKVYNIMAAGVRELVNDADYGSVPTFYVWLYIGEWNKPYKWVNGTVAVKIKEKRKN